MNNLTPAETERLAKLAEECGEVIQVIGKILLHGYESKHPDGGPTNREMLTLECGDVRAAIMLMVHGHDIDNDDIAAQFMKKSATIRKYMHHQYS